MINLLPPQQKEELLEEEKFKLVLILGIVFIAFLLSLFLILFSVRISISRELEIEKVFFKEKEREISLNKDLEEIIKDSNLNLSQLNSFYQSQLNLTEILEKISQILPQGIYLTSFNFNQEQISLLGFSPSREVLLLLEKNLEKEESFGDVFFPPENWLKLTDINFIVTFKLIKK